MHLLIIISSLHRPQACLVLAGPDPRAIADDPEGLEVLQELKEFFDSLPREVQRDIKLVEVRETVD